jgi:sulfate adenylyltransferase large subunit
MIATSMDAATTAYNQLELVRLTTAGSVDDGKSTLIGRLLYDCNALYEDQLLAAEKASRQKGMAELDFSLFTDGLAAEREQQITIDVAYRYFSTPKRRFIIADVPGHEQYTRNMVTGASTADVAVILVDARKGVVTQSRRHLFVASLLNIPHILMIVNKMDEVGYSQETFEKIEEELAATATRMEIKDLQFMPISALRGDMVVERGDRMPWYQGRTLYDYLENIQVRTSRNLIDFRFPVQMVLRPHQDFRGFAGAVESGIVRSGDSIVVLPSGKKSTIRSIELGGAPRREAFAGQSVVVTLSNEIDVSRGDMIVREHNLPEVGNSFEATISWFSDRPFAAGRAYLLKHTTKTVRCFVEEVRYSIDVDSLHRHEVPELRNNEIGRAYLRTTEPLMFDPYGRNRTTGNFVLIDDVTRQTAGVGMIVRKYEVAERNAAHRNVVWLKGLTGGTMVARRLAELIHEKGVDCEVLDGAVFQSREPMSYVAGLLTKRGVLVLASLPPGDSGEPGDIEFPAGQDSTEEYASFVRRLLEQRR